MSGKNIGNWFENGKTVLAKIRSLTSDATTYSSLSSEAISTSDRFAFLAGGDVKTLSDGIENGQRLSIKRLTAAGTTVLTPTTLYDGTTVSFDSSEYCELAWYDDGTYAGWMVVGGNATVA